MSAFASTGESHASLKSQRSLRVRRGGCLWVRHGEFTEGQDLGYSFGYGMLMPGAYHYVDWAGQILELNLGLRPARALELCFSGCGAFPRDQMGRISTVAA